LPQTCCAIAIDARVPIMRSCRSTVRAIFRQRAISQETQQRTDLRRALAQLTQRERELVLLAYGQGSTHQEIAGTLGLKTGSIKPLLFRARRKLARILRP
jgi:RNA polymerase sigma-70 factor (ECF subfamily)